MSSGTLSFTLPYRLSVDGVPTIQGGIDLETNISGTLVTPTATVAELIGSLSLLIEFGGVLQAQPIDILVQLGTGEPLRKVVLGDVIKLDPFGDPITAPVVLGDGTRINKVRLGDGSI